METKKILIVLKSEFTGAFLWKNGYPGSGTRMLSPGLVIDMSEMKSPMFAP